ncbi:MAG: tetratricopeptide repeat protein, partial [Casimicrobiaceae bacterium]
LLVAIASVLALAGSPQPVDAQTDELADGVRLFEARDFEPAMTIFTPLAKQGNVRATYWLGRIAMVQEHFDQAAKYFEQATVAADTSSELHLWLGRAYGEKAQHASFIKQPGLAKKTKAEWERAIALDPNNLEAHSDMVSFYLTAPGVMGGSHDKAKAEIEAIRAISPYRAGFEMAGLAMHDKNPTAAETALRALVASDPDSISPLIQLATLLQQQKKWDDAVALLHEALAKHPDETGALYQLGKTAALSGQNLDEGESALRKYLTLPPKPRQPPYAGAHFRLGMIDEHRADPVSAKAEYTQALALDPKLEEAKKALAKLGK